MNTKAKERKFTAGSPEGSSCKRKQMRESLNFSCFYTGFTCLKLIYSPLAQDGGSIKESGHGYLQWFLSFRCVASGLEKPLIAGPGVSAVAIDPYWS